jgi:hypothetical protein
LEGYQGVCTSSCEGVYDFPIEPVRVYTSSGSSSAIVDSKEEVGYNFQGIHHMISKGVG